MTSITDLSAYVKTSTGFAESTIAAVTTSVISFLSMSLRESDTVKLEGLGIFKAVDRPERQGRNPRTGELSTFKASRKIKFTPSKSFGVSVLPDSQAQSEAQTEFSEGFPLSQEFSQAIPLELLPGYIPSSPSSPSFPSSPSSPSSSEPVPSPTLSVSEGLTINQGLGVSSIPPIPSGLLPKVVTVKKVWNIKAPDESFVEVETNDLASWGVTVTTPIYSPETGWLLAGNIPELTGLLKS
ncbi:MAG: nucleoid DNA binding protein [Phormidium phage MIS-PhV1B]|jgi:Bacterial nucleoid DNA-binding protein|uniref:nucleoid DNA binding protein n=1 Tax=Phormidium phage MIS-PhV1B TaxID=1391456 RepID=UPI0003C929F3|nr:MAG: nucleoid DNA binding protein [Phormidium phage MIS-PhV1B]AGZ61826.1 MAG: nucleoid DNA binding protein [Phormidium phage MIS-PhV1B]